MENKQTRGIMLALLRSVYKKNLITGDMYNHALSNLPELPDYSDNMRHCADAKGEPTHGRVPD